MTEASLGWTIKCCLMHPRTIEKAVQLYRSRWRQQVVDQASDNEACHLRLEPVDATSRNIGTGIRTGRGGASVNKTQQEYIYRGTISKRVNTRYGATPVATDIPGRRVQ